MSLRELLGYELTKETPDHSTLSRWRRNLPEKVHRKVFEWVIGVAREEKILKERRIAIDSTTMEANAAMKSIVRKAEPLDALDFVARLLAHVPDPRRHLVHSYGACSNVVRGKLKAQGQAQRAESPASGPGALSPDLRDASPWGDGAAAAPPPQGVLARLSPSRPSAALPSTIESPVPSGRVSAAAELLELPRSTMRSKIEKYGLDSTDD